LRIGFDIAPEARLDSVSANMDPGADMIIACMAITASIEHPEESR
jgi:hypothetical protein